MKTGIIDLTEPSPRPAGLSLLTAGFRPFFLLAALYAAVAIPLYLAWLSGAGQVPQALPVAYWHAHEMLFGFAGAALGGFLLTAVPNWTGAKPVSGGPLGALVALWLLGRAAMLFIDVLPWWLVAAADLVFLPALGLSVAPALIAADNRRNYVFFMLLAVLTAANGLVHLGAGGVLDEARRGLYLALDIFLLMITVISGRIVPAFTNSFLLLRHPGSGPIGSRPALDRLAIASMAVVALSELVFGDSGPVVGIACLVAGVVLAVRFAHWRTTPTIGTPILLILHVGVAWLVLGLLARGLELVFGILPPTAALHILTIGAIGTMIMGVMSRATLGHSGRQMHAPLTMTIAYALLGLAVLSRLAGLTTDAALATPFLVASGAFWTAAFGLFAATIAPMVLSPRVDGGPSRC